MRRKRIFLASILMSFMFILTSCTMNVGNKSQKETFEIYFFNATDNSLSVEKFFLAEKAYASHEELVEKLVERIIKGPETPSLQGSMPVNLQVLESNLKEKIAYINFNHTYRTLKLEEQIMVRTSLVYTLTELEFVESVQILVEGEALTNNSAIKIEPIKRNDILVSYLEPNPPTNIQTITLYFAKENDDKLYPETRDIVVNNSIPTERYVIEQLIKGPTTPGLIRTLPENTKINDVKTQERVCQVDISYDLNAKPLSPVSEKLLTYSIVNSLTEMIQIDKVVFLMDGKKQTELNTSVDFRRDESLIGENQ